MDIKENVLESIGNTPIIHLNRIKSIFGLKADIFVKLERCNPTGSIKDRIAREMILDALDSGLINKDTVIIEPTSGNTGIGLASVCASLGLKLVIYMPDSCSIERVKMMRALGAEIKTTPGSLGMQGSILAAKERAKEEKSSFIPSQFDNKNNSLAHYKTTGPEIYSQMDGKIDLFVASFGTGGTLTGISRYLKEKNSLIKTIGLEPFSSPVITKGEKGPHKIQGIGAGFKPGVLELDYVDEVKTVKDEDAYFFTKLLAQKEGLFCGISSGANLFGCVEEAKLVENQGKNIVTVLPDDGERYLSVDGLFN